MQCLVAWCDAPSNSTNVNDMLSDKTILWNWYNWQITSFYPITNQGRILAAWLKQVISLFFWWFSNITFNDENHTETDCCGIKLGSWTVVECLVVLEWLKVQNESTECIYFHFLIDNIEWYLYLISFVICDNHLITTGAWFNFDYLHRTHQLHVLLPLSM